MEIFFASEVTDNTVLLGQDESVHCSRVLRHRTGDVITVVDGLGTMLSCRIADDSPKGVKAEILDTVKGWGGHPYSLNMAVCPTKNNDRFEWFVEKATELGVDVISPVFGDRSERKVFKAERSRKIAVAAMKQSLKAKLPLIEDPVPVRDFILSSDAEVSNSEPELKMICYCFEGQTQRLSVEDALEGILPGSRITILIGPEGDFSPEEVSLAMEHGFKPVHLGPSRLRTETAAVTAATAVYLHFIR